MTLLGIICLMASISSVWKLYQDFKKYDDTIERYIPEILKVTGGNLYLVTSAIGGFVLGLLILTGYFK